MRKIHWWIIGFVLVAVLSVGLVLWVSYQQDLLLEKPTITPSSLFKKVTDSSQSFSSQSSEKETPSFREWSSSSAEEKIEQEEAKQKEESSQELQEMAIEEYNSTYIKRGSFVSLSSDQKFLEIQDELTPNQGVVKIDVSGISQVTCWPEFITNPDGSQILLSKAYIPFVPHKNLSWPGQIVRDWLPVAQTLDSSKHVITKLTAAYRSGEIAEADQVVVLGCD